jgi:hypothetical protein
MPGFSDTMENKVLDHVFGGPDFTRDATLTMRLFTVAPGDDGTGGTEASYAGYAAVAITNNATNFPAAATGAKSNGTAIDFGTAGVGANQTVVAWGLYGGAGTVSAGNARCGDTLAVSKTIQEGDPVKFNIGDLTFNLS